MEQVENQCENIFTDCISQNYSDTFLSNKISNSIENIKCALQLKNRGPISNIILKDEEPIYVNNEVKCDSIENDHSMENGQRRYGLRKRKNIVLKDDNFYIFDISDKNIKKRANQKKIFKCSECTNSFYDRLSLVNHQNLQIKCHICNLHFCSKKIFDIHNKSCQNVISEELQKNCLKCQTCNKILKNDSQLKCHACSANKVSFQCNKCHDVFRSKSKLNFHIVKDQCANSSFTCDICQMTFSDFNILKKHISAHLGYIKYCLYCNLNFKSEKLLLEHKCKLAKEKKLSCNACNKIFKNEKRLKIHLLQHQGINYKCFKCDKLFLCEESLLKHETDCSLTIRKNDNFRKCEKCKKVFRKETEFCDHMNANNCENSSLLNIKKKYKCDLCKNKFSSISKLQIHNFNIHQSVKFKCKKCNMIFFKQEEYDNHTDKMDCKFEEPYSCQICGKVFAKKHYLKKHEYIHSNILYKCKFCYCAFMKEKNYKRHIEKMNCSKSARKIRLSEFDYKKCRLCNENFLEEEILLQHFNNIHPGQNAHQCFCCELCLPTFEDLQKHIHMHNTQKFTCNLCGKPYTSQEGFRKHRLKHKGAEFKCQFCDSQFLVENRLKFHEKGCKKNPENGCNSDTTNFISNKKFDKPKQSRQLHWESRIIMTHLRTDPNADKSKQVGLSNSHKDNISSSNFFDDSDDDVVESNVRGWFDDYYKTEEDDLAFGVRKESSAISQSQESNTENPQILKSGLEDKKEGSDMSTKSDVLESTGSVSKGTGADEMKKLAENNFDSLSSNSSDDSSEEEFVEDVELPVEYNPKKCRICLIIFSQEYELLHHFIKVHPEKRAHKCPNCETECPLFAQLKEHMKTHGIGIGVFNCDNCSKKFKSERKMRSHNIRCKGFDNNIVLSFGKNKSSSTFKIDSEDKCKRCGKKFQTKCGYRRHKQLCKEKYRCNKENKKTEELSKNCNANSVELSDIQATNNDIKFTTNLKISNEKCGATSDQSKIETKPFLKSKSEFHDDKGCSKDIYIGEPPLDSFACRLCDKKFQYERGIVMHFKSDHQGHKPLVCHICNMHLADKLKEHLKTHGIGEEFICELCGKRFNQKFLSKIHEMWHEGIEYKCNNCNQKFLNKDKMDKHINENRCSNRQSLMRLPCDICGKSYRSKFGLSKHYITHTPKELRPIKNRMNCEFCGKWFEHNNSLERHRRIHTGERPFNCRFCSKAFAQEGNRKAHERIHTGESRPRRKKTVENNTIPMPTNTCFMTM